MEKQGYRETREMLESRFPGKIAISVKDAAEVMDANINTVYEAVKSRRNPIPSQKLGGKIVIPLAQFARWLCC